MRTSNRHKGYYAFLAHRVSGVALALFLPFHFLLLGSSLGGVDALNRSLLLVDNPLFKIAEWGLVVFLTLHLLFGIRLLFLELTDWPSTNADDSLNLRTGWIVPAVITSFVVGGIFIFQMF